MSTQVLYEPARACPTKSEGAEDVAPAPAPTLIPRSPSRASAGPPVRQAGTQTQGTGPEACCSTLRSQILDLQGRIARLQKDMASLMEEDLEQENQERWKEVQKRGTAQLPFQVEKFFQKAG